MGLCNITTWPDADSAVIKSYRVVDRAKSVRYTVDGSTLKVGAEELVHWEVRRTCTKDYRYIGLTEAAAKACAAAKVEKYTRTSYVWARKTDTGYESAGVQACQADIAAVHDEGDAWHVDVQVSEEDTVHVTGQKPAALADLFAWIERACDYDEES